MTPSPQKEPWHYSCQTRNCNFVERNHSTFGNSIHLDTVKSLTPDKYCFVSHKGIYSVCAKSLYNPCNLSKTVRRINLMWSRREQDGRLGDILEKWLEIVNEQNTHSICKMRRKQKCQYSVSVLCKLKKKILSANLEPWLLTRVLLENQVSQKSFQFPLLLLILASTSASPSAGKSSYEAKLAWGAYCFLLLLDPFQLGLNPRFSFPHSQHALVLARRRWQRQGKQFPAHG